ncbi:MAG: HAD family hydrolase [Opitutales bacterium]
MSSFDQPFDYAGIRQILWDWNGTLVDDAPLSVRIINGVLAAYGLAAIDLAHHRRIFDFPLTHYYERLGFDLKRWDFETVGADFIRAYRERWSEAPLHADALPALEAYRASGLKQDILSATRQDMLDQAIDHYGLAPFFGSLTGQNNIYARGKLEAGRRWLAGSGLRADQVLLIGDTLHDRDIALELGMRCILVPRGHQAAEKMEDAGVPLRPDLRACLEGLV